MKILKRKMKKKTNQRTKYKIAKTFELFVIFNFQL